MTKKLSKSTELAAKLIFAALKEIQKSGGKLSIVDIFNRVGTIVELTEYDNHIYEKSGQKRWEAILGFYSTDCVKAGFIVKEKGIWHLTPNGEEALKLGAIGLIKAAGDAYRKWAKENKPVKTDTSDSDNNEEVIFEDEGNQSENVDDTLAKAYQKHRSLLREQILERIRTVNPYYFEEIVLQLLVKMGYGGTYAEAASTTKKSNDGGIDGFIKADRLGFDTIYIQAKRWAKDMKVGRKEVQEFLGALVGNGGLKGIFITTSSFTNTAIEFKNQIIQQKLILLDGEELADYMIEFNLGVSISVIYETKKIDTDFFEFTK